MVAAVSGGSGAGEGPRDVRVDEDADADEAAGAVVVVTHDIAGAVGQTAGLMSDPALSNWP
jgi:hypothetical protein